MWTPGAQKTCRFLKQGHSQAHRPGPHPIHTPLGDLLPVHELGCCGLWVLLNQPSWSLLKGFSPLLSSLATLPGTPAQNDTPN